VSTPFQNPYQITACDLTDPQGKQILQDCLDRIFGLIAAGRIDIGALTEELFERLQTYVTPLEAMPDKPSTGYTGTANTTTPWVMVPGWHTKATTFPNYSGNMTINETVDSENRGLTYLRLGLDPSIGTAELQWDIQTTVPSRFVEWEDAAIRVYYQLPSWATGFGGSSPTRLTFYMIVFDPTNTANALWTEQISFDYPTTVTSWTYLTIDKSRLGSSFRGGSFLKIRFAWQLTSTPPTDEAPTFYLSRLEVRWK
jgi:hypothetical protein